MIDMTREGKTLEAASLDTLAQFTATARTEGWEPHGRAFDSVIEPGSNLQPVRRHNPGRYRAWLKQRAAEISGVRRTHGAGAAPRGDCVQLGLETGEHCDLNQIPILKLAALAKLTRRQTDALRFIANTVGRGD